MAQTQVPEQLPAGNSNALAPQHRLGEEIRADRMSENTVVEVDVRIE